MPQARDQHFHFRLSPLELAQVQIQAKAAGLSASNFARRRTLAEEPSGVGLGLATANQVVETTQRVQSVEAEMQAILRRMIGFDEQLSTLKWMTGATIASSALLLDNGKLDQQELRLKIRKHLEMTKDVADVVVDMLTNDRASPKPAM